MDVQAVGQLSAVFIDANDVEMLAEFGQRVLRRDDSGRSRTMSTDPGGLR